METVSSTRVNGPGRVAAGLTLASYVISHPSLCWTWLGTRSIAGQLRLREYVLTLILVSVAAGFLRSVAIGVYVPVYGFWRMPFLDALGYYSVVLLWCAGMVLAGSLLLRTLASRFGGQQTDFRIWVGVVAFASTPFLLSGLLVFVPSEILRTLLSLGTLYSLFLFRRGIENLNLVPPTQQSIFCVVGSLSMISIGALSLWLLMSLCMPSYPARSLSEPVLSHDVLDFKRSLEQLAWQKYGLSLHGEPI